MKTRPSQLSHRNAALALSVVICVASGLSSVGHARAATVATGHATAPSTGRAGTACPVQNACGGDSHKANVNSGLCLDSAGGAIGPHMHQWQCLSANGQPIGNQGWGIYLPSNVGVPWHSIYNPYYNKCLDIPGGNPNNGVQVQLYACNGSPAQLFQTFYPGYINGGEIVSYVSNKCLEVKGWSRVNGGIVDMWTCGAPVYGGGHQQANQTWYTPAGG